MSAPSISDPKLSWHARLVALDRRWIFAATFVVVLVPLLWPIQLPLPIDAAARHYYEAIEALPAGATVLMPFDYEPAFTAENHPMAVATLRRLLEKNVRVIAVTLQPAGPPMADLAFRTVGPPLHKTYGVDFVNLGYKSGNEVVVLGLGASVRNVYPFDMHGAPVASLPILRNVDRLGQMQMIVEIAATSAGNIWVQQAQGRFHVPMVAGVSGVMAPEFFPYLQAGQIKGMLGGMAGAAQYEFLLKRADTATKGMAAQSMAHLLIILLIVGGNLLWLAGQGGGRKRQAASGSGVAIALVGVLLALGLVAAGCGGGAGSGHGGRAGAAGAAGSGERGADAPPDTGRDGNAFVATYDDGPVDQIRIVRDTSGGIVAAGSTSFPDGTRITVALERPRPDHPNQFEAVTTTQGEVVLGRFSSLPLKLPDGTVASGPVRLRVTASFMPGAQSVDVLTATGNGRRFRGQGMHEVGAYSIYEVDLEAPI